MRSREEDRPTSSVLLFGTGQVGVFAARALTQRGCRVQGADAAPDCAFYARFGPGADTPEPVKLDVTSLHDVETFVRSHRDSTAVVFAAGYTGARATAEPVSARLVAERGVSNVLGAASTSGIRRAVVISSLAVYGGVVEGDRFAEDGPTEPRTAYGEIQLTLEGVARAFSEDLEVDILRVAGVFGPKRFGYGSHSSRFVERMLYAAANGYPIRIEGSWEDEDDLIYVKDVGEAISAAALTPDIGAFTVNVGLGRVSTLREIADAVRCVFPMADIAVIPPSQHQDAVRCVPIDSASLTARLGIRPAFPLTAAIRDYASETGLIHDN
jgi:UDP-glucose 4-epimerase